MKLYILPVKYANTCSCYNYRGTTTVSVWAFCELFHIPWFWVPCLNHLKAAFSTLTSIAVGGNCWIVAANILVWGWESLNHQPGTLASSTEVHTVHISRCPGFLKMHLLSAWKQNWLFSTKDENFSWNEMSFIGPLLSLSSTIYFLPTFFPNLNSLKSSKKRWSETYPTCTIWDSSMPYALQHYSTCNIVDSWSTCIFPHFPWKISALANKPYRYEAYVNLQTLQ